MGGRAFQSRGWQAPRLSPKLYNTISSQIRLVLDDLYEQVCCPPSVWEKPDHGDVDFIVVEGEKVTDPTTLAEHIGAQGFITNGPSTSYAIPHPEIPKAIVQIDIRHCPADLFDWQNFTNSYADLGQVLAFLLRPIRLKITDKGFLLRQPRVQGKDDLTWLTSDPKAVIGFLGLSEDSFQKGFATEYQVFDFLLSGHLARPTSRPSELRKKDRVLVKKRPMFRRFIEEYLPSLSDDEDGGSGRWTVPSEARDAALEYFNCRHECWDNVNDTMTYQS